MASTIEFREQKTQKASNFIEFYKTQIDKTAFGGKYKAEILGQFNPPAVDGSMQNGMAGVWWIW